MIDPQRGEIWLVELDPTRGTEIQKTRPTVVISSNLFCAVPIRIIVPVTSWQPKFTERPFMVPILRTSENGLEKDSGGNVLQIRSISVKRFTHYLGKVKAEVIEELLAGLVICVDYE